MAVVHLEFNPEDVRAFVDNIMRAQQESARFTKDMMRDAGFIQDGPHSYSRTVSERPRELHIDGLGELISILKEQMSMAKGFMDPETVNAIKQSVLAAAKECTNKCKLSDLEKTAEAEKPQEA